ncbi:DNA alkylation repair protein [Candidatus Uhrbacteria bacterium]|nr:DNA alkylation repair protein [Candidatus Uhrbacteria bacterium]
MTQLTASSFLFRLQSLSSSIELEKTLRFFKTGKGQYSEDDMFIGVRMGAIFSLAKEYVDMPLFELEKLLQDPIHEARAGALSIMGKATPNKKMTAEKLKLFYEMYLRNHIHINNWDLVDMAAYKVVGRYLLDKPRTILYQLVKSKNMWERRTAIVSTWAFSKQGDTKDVFMLAEMLLQDKEDLLHKATGWMLRSAGSKDQKGLITFLDAHADVMPRTMLRYSLEKFPMKERMKYMKKNG